MDVITREQKKRKQFIRVILAEIIMVLAVIAIAVGAILITMGFSFGEDGVEQSGLVQLHSIPTGATATIDGEAMFARTNLSQSLSAGNHNIVLSRDGYDTWSKDITVYSGVLTRLYYPRLFLTERVPEKMADLGKTLEFYSTSKDRNYILYAENDNPVWKIVDTQNDEIKIESIDLKKILPGMKDGKFTGQVQKLEWDNNGEHVLLKVVVSGTVEWILVDLEDTQESLNITKTFGLDFNYVEMVGGSAGQLFALQGTQLRRIDTGSESMSRILLSDVESFASKGSNLIYVSTKNTEDKRSIKIYRNGEKAATDFLEIVDDEPVKVVLSSYYEADYIGVVLGNEMTVYYGELPSYVEKTEKKSAEEYANEKKAQENKLKVLVEQDLGLTPKNISVSPGGEYLVARDSRNWAVIDLDMGELSKYESPATNLNWLDDSMMFASNQNQMQVWDFDGQNQRVLLQSEKNTSTASAATSKVKGELTNYPVMITNNDKWLYYPIKTDGALQLFREKIWN